tara:strand:+ start:497 stop:658 length:162 start_codon:yes stop_codon:yes gene_type:complete
MINELTDTLDSLGDIAITISGQLPSILGVRTSDIARQEFSIGDGLAEWWDSQF